MRFSRGIPLLAWLIAACANSVYADWQLVWSDEFNGTGINSNNWTFDAGTGPPYPGWGNNELEYYTTRPQNAYVTNGLLHLVAIKETYNGSSYTSARMKTAGLFSHTYGRFEFRAKLPAGQGYWPGLWMMPRDSVYGGWAASGEIDVMENKGSDSGTVLGTIHFGSTYPNQAQSFGPSFTFPTGDSVTNFHLYALEWTTNSIRWYVDSQLYETQTSWWSSGGSYPAPFEQPFYLIMNLAVGGNFGGNPDGTTLFPGEMQVDYVRVYDAVFVPPPPPVLKLTATFDDSPGTTIAATDTNAGGVPVTLQMLNGSGVAADYHGAAKSGVAGAITGSRALNFSSNTAQPGQPGPSAAVTNANLGFGIVSNFVVTMWFKQDSLMSGNIGPRLFLLGTGTPADTGAPNSLGLKFQTASQLYFQLGAFTAPATFSTNLPTNTWIFVAAAYDGANLMIYQGAETNVATLISTTAVVTNVNFGASGALYIGNKQDRQRSFDGWLDDVPFYRGSGDANFVETVRLQAITPPAISIQRVGANVMLNWTSGALQAATNLLGPWTELVGTNAPYSVSPAAPQQFYRLKLP